MVDSTPETPYPSLRDQIAAVAARLIAEDGLDYAGAKRRAARELLGDGKHADCMPDNPRVEAAVREYQALFMADTQPGRLAHLRRMTLDVMDFLDDAGTHLEWHAVGAVVNGTAGEHSDIHLQVRDDNAKDLEIFLLNAGVEFDVVETDGGGETLSFLWPPRGLLQRRRYPGIEPEVVHLTVVGGREPRSSRPGERADRRAMVALLGPEPSR